MAAASAGHLHCLKSLQQRGEFLGLGSPDRGSAGETRKLQVWQAALSACIAGHAGVLSWLFASGWFAEIDAYIPVGLQESMLTFSWGCCCASALGCLEAARHGEHPEHTLNRESVFAGAAAILLYNAETQSLLSQGRPKFGMPLHMGV
jgi:hypothetical protein